MAAQYEVRQSIIYLRRVDSYLSVGPASVGGIWEKAGYPQRQTGKESGVRIALITPVSILLTLEFSQTVVEGWTTLQVANRHHLVISVDLKAAQNEGE